MTLKRPRSAADRRAIKLLTPRQHRTRNGEWRLSAKIGGHEVYFQSAKRMHDGPESFLSAFLLPAMALGRDIDTEAPICEEWYRNIASARECAVEWWGYRGGEVHGPLTGPNPESTQTGLFFSGGVDAFHSLVANADIVDKLVFIAGADTRLAQARRRDQDQALLASAAERKGLEMAIVATNLRHHPVFQRVGWYDSHGGALAAVAHALSGYIGSAIVAGSVLRRPHGSHPRLIPAFSSSRMRMSTHGDGVARSAKLSLLISDPVAMAHLRVCWEHGNGGEFLNCGVCEKCLRTLLEIEAVQPGASARLPTFPPGSLEARLSQLQRIPDHLVPLWKDLGERQRSSPALFAQIQRLTNGERAEQRMRPKIRTRVVEGYRELRAQWSLILG